MNKVILDLWIITEAGVLIFNRKLNEQVDPFLFGSMIKLLDSQANQISKEGLVSFELENKCYSILKRGELMFIASYWNNSDEEIVMRELKKISDKFFDKYPNQLNNFKGNIGVFFGFKNEIRSSLAEY